MYECIFPLLQWYFASSWNMCGSIYIFAGLSCYSPSWWEMEVCHCETKVSRVSWHCHQRGPRKVLLNIVHPSCLQILILQLDCFREGICGINWFLVVWNVSLLMFWKFLSRDFGYAGVSKLMPIIVRASGVTDLIDFNVVFTRRNSILNLPRAVWTF